MINAALAFGLSTKGTTTGRVESSRYPGMPEHHMEPWTDKLCSKLRVYAKRHSIKELCEIFGRTENSILAKLQHLHIKHPELDEHYTKYRNY